MSSDYVFGCYPTAVRIIAQSDDIEEAAQSIRFFINEIQKKEDATRAPVSTEDSFIKLVFPVGDKESDFFLNKEAADRAGATDENWGIHTRQLSEDGRNYTITLEPKLTGRLLQKGGEGIESICELSLAPLYPNKNAGSAAIQVQLCLDGEKSSGELVVKKIEDGVVVRKFYAEPYCAAAGDKVKIYWDTANAGMLSLYLGEVCIKDHLVNSGRAEITLQESGRCRLLAGGVEIGSLPLQVLPVHLERFEYSMEDGEIYWDVYGADQVKVDHVEVNAHSSKRAEPKSGETLCCYLSAEGGGRKLYSWLMAQKEITDAPMAVKRLQKTITEFEGFQVLHVAWETAGFQKIWLVYQDYERGTVYPVGGVGKKGTGAEQTGEWEQLIYGSNVKITLEAVLQDGKSFHITI